MSCFSASSISVRRTARHWCAMIATSATTAPQTIARIGISNSGLFTNGSHMAVPSSEVCRFGKRESAYPLVRRRDGPILPRGWRRQESEGGVEGGARAGPDQEEQRLPRPALGRVGAQEAGALAGR